MRLVLGVVCSLILLVGLTQYAYADVIIWQVEANPRGADSGNEWLTIINTGSEETLYDYIVKSTHGRIASKPIPDITLNNCEYYKVTFSKQAIDNRDEIMRLIKSGQIIYETPTLQDTKNDYRIWTNSDGSVCSNPKQVFPITMQEPKIITGSLESRISELEKENRELKQIIVDLESYLKSIMAILSNFNR